MITFAVSDVVPATEPLPVIPYHEAVSDFLGGQVESCSRYHGELVCGTRGHPLIEALHAAFATHRPICLTPDVVWLTLTQGLAYHVNANAEQLRHRFVQHQGKMKIEVRRDHFEKGSPENDWPGVFAEFSEKIQSHIGDAHALIVADFSTTGPVERAASEIVLMDAMQAYFIYVVSTLCGIPSITLEGTLEDWHAIRRRAQQFNDFGLEWWITELVPILDQFVAAASGTIDRVFWDSIYKWNGANGSGKSPYVSGWILKLFPYLNPSREDYSPSAAPDNSFCRNPWINQALSRHKGPEPSRFPRLPARVPFLWEYFGTNYKMEFIGGLIGIRQDPESLCLRPEIGWAIWELGAEERKAQADTEARELAAEITERARIVERAKTEVVAPRIDPDQPRHSQFFHFVCPSCKHSEEIGLWYTYKSCVGCQRGWRIVRPPVGTNQPVATTKHPTLDAS